VQAKYPASPGLFLSTGGMPAKPLSLEHLIKANAYFGSLLLTTKNVFGIIIPKVKKGR
jgi:hypothetical protein